MLQVGSRGSAVTTLQQWLKNNGFDPGPIDGIFGSRTAAAVRSFQQAAGIQVDAIVGPQTQGSMDSWGGGSSGPVVDPGTVTPGTEPQGELPDDIKDIDPAGDPTGSIDGGTGGADFPGVLAGGELIKIERAGADDLWMMAYEWPTGSGKFISWQFDNADQLQSVFGSNWWEKIQVNVRAESFLDTVQVMDNADEIIGHAGNFTGLMTDTIRNAAQIAGINDPTSMTLVEVGSSIEKNEVIALSGSTGRSTAPHLHFEVTLNGAPVDPLTLIVQP